MSTETPVPLIFLRPGMRAVIVDLNAGPGLRRRLLQLGFIPGEFIEVTHNFGLTVVVRLGSGATIALSKGVAQKIYVRVLP